MSTDDRFGLQPKREGSGNHQIKNFPDKVYLQFPKVIDYFRDNVVRRWGTSQHISSEGMEPLLGSSMMGRIRKVIFRKNNYRLIVAVRGNRLCMNVRKQHKSNSINFVVDIKNFCYDQRCHNEECNHFRSKSFNLDPALFFI